MPASAAPRSLLARVPALAEIAWAFGRLGCLSFGGPAAHIGYFHAEFVVRRRWLDEARYADLVALCQLLPGPASSQVVFALGGMRAGLLGALTASLCFTLPSAALMIAFAYGVAGVSDLASAGWLHGLKLAAVAVVAQAVWGMGRRLCTDRATISLCLGSAAALLLWPGALSQVGVIAVGALVGVAVLGRHEAPAPQPNRAGHRGAVAALVTFAGLLMALPVLAAETGSPAIALFDRFYRAGSLVFGGGHVVLPLLRAELVPAGWIGDDAFLAGYAAAQAVPGPLFTFAAYLGAAMGDGPERWVQGAWCLLAIFAPAWLLVGGALPFWDRLRARPWARAAFAGASASVVGVLLAALHTPIVTESVHGPVDAAVALLAFAALEVWKAPPWSVVAGLAAWGVVAGGG